MKKLIFGILMVFGLISVSMGAWIHEEYEANYQKLKAELEMWDLVDFEKRCYTRDLNHIKNVIAFFDEIRARKVDCGKKRCLGDDFAIARREVREMPLFKNDSFIYSYTRSNNLDQFWKEVWNKWDFTKIELEGCGAKKAYWEAVKESK